MPRLDPVKWMRHRLLDRQLQHAIRITEFLHHRLAHISRMQHLAQIRHRAVADFALREHDIVPAECHGTHTAPDRDYADIHYLPLLEAPPDIRAANLLQSELP